MSEYRKPPGGLTGRRLRQWYTDVLGYVPLDWKKKNPIRYVRRKL